MLSTFPHRNGNMDHDVASAATGSSTNAAVAGAPPRPPGKQRKRKRGNPSSEKRMDTLREIQGAKFEAERRRRIEEATGGFSADIPLPKLTEVSSTVTPLMVEIPVETRGIGFSATLAFEKLRQQFPAKVDGLANIQQVYRASLAQAWLVRARCQETRAKETLNPDEYDDVFVPFDLQIVEGFRENFGLVANAISSYGWFDHGGSSYWPTVPVTPMYDDDTIQPYSGLVKAEELRQVVVALATDDVPLEDRERFRDSNSLPGATWDDDALLTNGDVICPDGWPDRASLRDDLLALNAVLEFARTKAPGLLGSVDYSGRGSCNGLVSRRVVAGDSSLVIRNGRPAVNFSPLEDFYTAVPVDEQPLLRGALSLAGEWTENFSPPYRHECSASRRVNLDWLRIADHAISIRSTR